MRNARCKRDHCLSRESTYTYTFLLTCTRPGNTVLLFLRVVLDTYPFKVNVEAWRRCNSRIGRAAEVACRVFTGVAHPVPWSLVRGCSSTPAPSCRASCEREGVRVRVRLTDDCGGANESFGRMQQVWQPTR